MIILPRKRPRYRLYSTSVSHNLFYLKRKFLWWWLLVPNKAKFVKCLEFRWFKNDADDYVKHVYGQYDPMTKRRKKSELIKEYM